MGVESHFNLASGREIIGGAVISVSHRTIRFGSGGSGYGGGDNLHAVAHDKDFHVGLGLRVVGFKGESALGIGINIEMTGNGAAGAEGRAAGNRRRRRCYRRRGYFRAGGDPHIRAAADGRRR